MEVYINNANCKEFLLYEISDSIGSQERHKIHMQLLIYLTDYLAKVTCDYLNNLECELEKLFSMDIKIDGVSIPDGFREI